jgi:hypothetical protein
MTMIGIVLLAVWASLIVAYLLRQQLRGELSDRARPVPPLPWRGAATPSLRSVPLRDRAA